MKINSTIRTRKLLLGSLLIGMMVLLVVGASNSTVVYAQAGEPTATPETDNPYFTSRQITLADGTHIEETIIDGPPQPPPGFARPTVSMSTDVSAQGVNILTVPAFDWSFGCSATSGSMIAAYYDRNGYPNMYTGPTTGGVMPLDSSVWGTWYDGHSGTYAQCPLTASRNGLDGRTTRGSIDDYWYGYMMGKQDPFITNGWVEHSYGDAIGDYMRTSQYNFYNDDGSTTFWNYPSAQLTCSSMASMGLSDGTLGRKLFYEAKGYTVTDCYNQKTDNTGGGFTYTMYKAQIDAGQPVMLNLAGHTIVGIGYDSSSNTVYLHDTWDYDTHSMTWGGSYSGMVMQSVSIVNLTYTLMVTKNGTGSGTVISSPTGINCGSTCAFAFPNDAVVTLTAAPTGLDSFDGWSGEACSGTGTCTVTMNAARSVSATFTHNNQAPNLPVLVRPTDNATGVAIPTNLEVTVSDPDADALNVTFYGRVVPSQDFRIALFPDTQNESTFYPAVYTSQTTWIANNKISQNIVFVTHAGDIVNTSDDTTQWGNADTSMDVLDAGNVPYSVGPGNHDLEGLYNTYFGIDRFSGKSFYAGYYGSDNYNNYSLFSASGMDFILINLQYNPSTALLDWADARLKQYPTRRGILVSHSILNIDNSFTAEGTSIFNALKDNANLFLMLCGHMHTSVDGAAYLAQTGNDGHVIHIMEADYQEFANGGNGYLRMLRFSPADDKIHATTYSPFDGTSITTSPDQMEMAYDMPGNTAFGVIGTINGVASGTNASVSWPGLVYGSSYEWYAVANDGALSATSSTWHFTTVASTTPSAPTGVSASDGTYTDRVRISWSTASGATWYQVYRNTSSSASGAVLVGSSQASPHGDTNAAPGTTYWYFVKACTQAGCSVFSSSDSGYRAKVTSSTSITNDTPDPSVMNQSYTVSVTVGGSFGTPTGTVSINDGTGGTCGVPLSGGSGSCALTSTTYGNKTLTATYSGDGTYSTSSGTSLHTVNPLSGQSSITIITNDTPDPSYVTQSYTVSVTVSGSYGTPTGTVNITDGSADCNATLSGGKGSCALASTTLGSKTLTATYSGNSIYNSSSGTSAHTVSIQYLLFLPLTKR